MRKPQSRGEISRKEAEAQRAAMGSLQASRKYSQKAVDPSARASMVPTRSDLPGGWRETKKIAGI
jgi:hypothetical protein